MIIGWDSLIILEVSRIKINLELRITICLKPQIQSLSSVYDCYLFMTHSDTIPRALNTANNICLFLKCE